jgi:hypothetical protein
LPPDAESSFPYAAPGSWESTRNLRLSVRDGFLPWAIIASVAPRRLIYYHEFYWDQDHDPVWKRLQTVTGFHDAGGSLTGLAGHGFVVGSSPENSHWTPYSRELLYPTLERWFGIANPKKEYDKLIPEEQLLCFTSPEAKQHNPAPLHLLCSRLCAERMKAARGRLEKLSAVERTLLLRKQWADLLGAVEAPAGPAVRAHEQEQKAGIAVERIQLETEPGIIVPVLMLVPEAGKPRRVVVAVAQAGKESFLRHRSGQIAELLDAGAAVCLPDLRGTGETDPGDGRDRSGTATSVSSTGLMLGRPLAGARLRDLRQVIRYLRQRDDVDGERIALWGDSFAEANAADCNFAVPHGIADRPRQPEPLGGVLVLLAALFDEKIEAIHVHGGLIGFHDVLSRPICYLPHDMVIPGVLTAGDLCDVAAALAPRPLRLDGLVDGLNRRQSAEQVRAAYAPATASYRRVNAGRQLVITDNEMSIARWLYRGTGSDR